MAGVFDTSDMGGPQGSPVSVKEPIGQPDSMLSNLSGVAQEAVKFGIDSLKEKEDVGPVNNLIQSQLKVARAVNRGEMTPAQAQVLWGRNLNNAMSQYPELDHRDFLKAHDSVVKTAGVGQIAQTGNEEYLRKKKIIDEATAEGFLPLGATEDQKEVGLMLFRQKQAITQEMEMQKDLIGLKKDRLGLSKSEIELQNSQEKQRSNHLLQSFISNRRQTLDLQIRTVKQRAELPPDNPAFLTKEEALQEYDRLAYDLQSQLQGIGPFAGSENISAAAKPTLEYINKMKSVVDGTMELEAATTTYSNSLKQLQVIALKEDPQLRALIATENMLSNSPINLANIITAKTIDTLATHAKAANGTGDGGVVVPSLVSDAEKANTNAYSTILKQHTRDFLAGKLSQDQVKQLDNHHESIMKTVGQSPNSSPKDLLPLVNYLSSPEFGQYVKRRGGLPAGKEDAIQVLKRQYEQQVVPVVRDEIENRFLGIDFAEDIEAEWVGDSVVFSVRAGITDPASSYNAKRALDDLNKEVAPHMTRLINLSSNFSGESPKSEYQRILSMVGLGEGKMVEEQAPQESTEAPELHPEDVAWIKAGETLAEKKRRAEALGISPELISQATRGR